MELSIIIPARSEMFLRETVEDLVKHCEAGTEIIVTLDGKWADPPLVQHPMVNIIFVPKSIGQRAAQNIAARLARGKYIAKVDAHCSFDQGFDRKMIDAFKKTGDNVVMAPVMNNLHAFNWKCRRCKWTQYQAPTPPRCGWKMEGEQWVKTDKGCNDSRYIKREMIWKSRRGVHSTSYSFDSEPHFKYFEDWKHRPQYIKDKAERGLTETMSLQGSFFMCTRENYWKLKLCDEEFGSWGNQGMEVACKMWLSGGQVLVNHKAWYAHMFRTQGGDFGFPYPQSNQSKTKAKVREAILNNKLPHQIYPLRWLLEKFGPVPGWDEKSLAELPNLI